MFFNGKHIGGLELGPVLRNFLGDPNLCATYEAKARLLLGELKRKMQLGGIKDGITRQTLEDKVKLYARSNQYGLADIDEIGIDVTELAVAVSDDSSVVISEKVIGFVSHLYGATLDELSSFYQLTYASSNGKDKQLYKPFSGYSMTTKEYDSVEDGAIPTTFDRQSWDITDYAKQFYFGNLSHVDAMQETVNLNGYPYTWSSITGLPEWVAFYADMTTWVNDIAQIALGYMEADVTAAADAYNASPDNQFALAASPVYAYRNTDLNVSLSAAPTSINATEITWSKSDKDHCLVVLPGNVTYTFLNETAWEDALKTDFASADILGTYSWFYDWDSVFPTPRPPAPQAIDYGLDPYDDTGIEPTPGGTYSWNVGTTHTIYTTLENIDFHGFTTPASVKEDTHIVEFRGKINLTVFTEITRSSGSKSVKKYTKSFASVSSSGDEINIEVGTNFGDINKVVQFVPA